MTALSTREWASVFWAMVLVVVVLCSPRVRGSLLEVIKAAWHWKLVLAWLSMLVWFAVCIMIGRHIGLWDRSLLKDTVIWLILSSLPTFFSVPDAPKSPRFFRKTVVAAVGLIAVVQFVINLTAFHIVIELILQPLVAVLTTMAFAARTDAKYAPVSRGSNALLSLIGIVVILATAFSLTREASQVDVQQSVLAFCFSVWLPVAMLPWIFTFAAMMTYGKVFSVWRVRL